MFWILEFVSFIGFCFCDNKKNMYILNKTTRIYKHHQKNLVCKRSYIVCFRFFYILCLLYLGIMLVAFFDSLLHILHF